MAVKIARLFGKGHLPIAKVLRTLQVGFITQICSKYQIIQSLKKFLRNRLPEATWVAGHSWLSRWLSCLFGKGHFPIAKVLRTLQVYK